LKLQLAFIILAFCAVVNYFVHIYFLFGICICFLSTLSH